MSTHLERLAPLLQLGLIGDLEYQFASLMCRLDRGGSPELALVAALTCSSTRAGNVCLDLTRPELPEAVAAAWPDTRGLRQCLLRSTVVGSPGEFRPLVLDAQGRCYLYRYWHYEQRLADQLRQRAGDLMSDVDGLLLADGVGRYFAQPLGEATDWQRVAAITALLRRLCIISGGPGTGKTTTVVKILALLIEQGGDPRDQEPVIALAAPTGKAAARLQESVRSAGERLALPDPVRAAIPQEAQTLHRLLGYQPGRSRFRYHAGNPLPLDVLVLDEASMVDLALMTKTLEALPQRARLILLGDRDQLASVEAGAVLGDICGDIPGFSRAFAGRVAATGGDRLTDLQGAGAGIPLDCLADSLVQLRTSYRFGLEGGIGRLAAAVNGGDAQRTTELLGGGGNGQLFWLKQPTGMLEQIVDGFRDYLRLLSQGSEPRLVLQAFERYRVLCALRMGPAGVERLNEQIEQALDSAGLIEVGAGPWYAGRPVLITRNDYGLRLYNGDVGILMPDARGELHACFPAADGRIRQLAPARLPEHESAYCMTVHKSQGSEFERVLLVLPEQDSPVLSRELLYTAITRSRSAFGIMAGEKTIEKTVNRKIIRRSGLRDLLWREEKSDFHQMAFPEL